MFVSQIHTDRIRISFCRWLARAFPTHPEFALQRSDHPPISPINRCFGTRARSCAIARHSQCQDGIREYHNTTTTFLASLRSNFLIHNSLRIISSCPPYRPGGAPPKCLPKAPREALSRALGEAVSRALPEALREAVPRAPPEAPREALSRALPECFPLTLVSPKPEQSQASACARSHADRHAPALDWLSGYRVTTSFLVRTWSLDFGVRNWACPWSLVPCALSLAK